MLIDLEMIFASGIFNSQQPTFVGMVFVQMKSLIRRDTTIVVSNLVCGRLNLIYSDSRTFLIFKVNWVFASFLKKKKAK